MAKKYRNKAQENSRVIRIPLSTYAALRQLATDAQVSVGAVVEALAKLEPIEKRKPVVPGAQMWFRVTPPPPQFNLDVKPKSNIEIKPRGGRIDG